MKQDFIINKYLAILLSFLLVGIDALQAVNTFMPTLIGVKDEPGYTGIVFTVDKNIRNWKVLKFQQNKNVIGFSGIDGNGLVLVVSILYKTGKLKFFIPNPNVDTSDPNVIINDDVTKASMQENQIDLTGYEDLDPNREAGDFKIIADYHNKKYANDKKALMEIKIPYIHGVIAKAA